MATKIKRRSPATKALEEVLGILKMSIEFDDHTKKTGTSAYHRIGFAKSQIVAAIEVIEAAQKGEKQ